MKYSCAVILMAAFACQADDAAIAAALAESGAALSAKGHTQQARDFLYRALATDETCASALFELGKIEDAAGNKSLSAEFFQRCLLYMKDATKRSAAESRLRVLDPAGFKLQSAMDEYARGLEVISKRHPDQITAEVLAGRVSAMQMNQFLPESKMPKLAAPPKPPDSPFDPVGKWKKSTNSILTIRANHTLDMTNVTGTWKISGNTLTIVYDKFWGTTTCVFTGPDGFTEGPSTYTRIKGK